MWFIETSVEWCSQNKELIVAKLRKSASRCLRNDATACIEVGEAVKKFVDMKVLFDGSLEDLFEETKYWRQSIISHPFFDKACKLGSKLACIRKTFALRSQNEARRIWKKKGYRKEVRRRCGRGESYACFLLWRYFNQLGRKPYDDFSMGRFRGFALWLTKGCASGWCRACLKIILDGTEKMKENQKHGLELCRQMPSRKCSRDSISSACWSASSKIAAVDKAREIELLARAVFFGDSDDFVSLRMKCIGYKPSDLEKKCLAELSRIDKIWKQPVASCGLEYVDVFDGINVPRPIVFRKLLLKKR